MTLSRLKSGCTIFAWALGVNVFSSSAGLETRSPQNPDKSKLYLCAWEVQLCQPRLPLLEEHLCRVWMGLANINLDPIYCRCPLTSRNQHNVDSGGCVSLECTTQPRMALLIHALGSQSSVHQNSSRALLEPRFNKVVSTECHPTQNHLFYE